MTELTKEWLLRTIAELEEERDSMLGVVNEDAAMALAAMKLALASLEAEPVGEVVLGEYDDCGCHPDARVACIAADGQADWENFKDGTRLYAAPPSMVVIDERAAFNAWNNDENLPIAGVGAKNAAWLAWQARAKLAAPPAPASVPDEVYSDDCPDLYPSQPDAWAAGWNACRDAMLQGADGNSPVIPDGWVACSERMPETDGNYWGWWSESKRQGPVWFIKSELQEQFQSSEITHWMPLPAAPQQEVKP